MGGCSPPVGMVSVGFLTLGLDCEVWTLEETGLEKMEDWMKRAFPAQNVHGTVALQANPCRCDAGTPGGQVKFNQSNNSESCVKAAPARGTSLDALNERLVKARRRLARQWL